jgi:integrase
VKYGADRRLITIGRHPLISLADAREEAKRILAEHTLGRIRPKSITYASAVALFLKDKAHARRPATVNSYRNKLGRMRFRGQLSEITDAEAARQLDKIKAPSERSHVLVAAKVFFNWCLDRRYISDNPFRGLHKPQSTPRARVLTDDELRNIWRVCEVSEQPPESPHPAHFATIVRLLILTGLRRGECAALRREYIQDDVLVLPPD